MEANPNLTPDAGERLWAAAKMIHGDFDVLPHVTPGIHGPDERSVYRPASVECRGDFK